MSENLIFRRNILNNEFLLLLFVLFSGVFSYVFRDSFIDAVTAKVWIVIVLSVLLTFSFVYKIFKFFSSPLDVCFYTFDKIVKVDLKKYNFSDFESVVIYKNRSSYGFLIRLVDGELVNIRPFYKLYSGSLERLESFDFVSVRK